MKPIGKTEPLGLGFGQRNAGASVSGRGDLGGVGEVQLWGVGVVIGLVSSGGAGFAHLVTFSPLSFSHPFPTPKPPL